MTLKEVKEILDEVAGHDRIEMKNTVLKYQ